jgi:hypothetical protein
MRHFYRADEGGDRFRKRLFNQYGRDHRQSDTAREEGARTSLDPNANDPSA